MISIGDDMPKKSWHALQAFAVPRRFTAGNKEIKTNAVCLVNFASTLFHLHRFPKVANLISDNEASGAIRRETK